MKKYRELSQEQIIQELKHPANADKDLYQIAELLNVPMLKVSEAQQATLKKIKRDSPLWNLKYFGRTENNDKD